MLQSGSIQMFGIPNFPFDRRDNSCMDVQQPKENFLPKTIRKTKEIQKAKWNKKRPYRLQFPTLCSMVIRLQLDIESNTTRNRYDTNIPNTSTVEHKATPMNKMKNEQTMNGML